MITDDFGDDSSPTVWPAVNSDDRGRELETSAGGGSFMWVESDLSFETTLGADDGTIVGLNEVNIIAIARHILVFLRETLLNKRRCRT